MISENIGWSLYAILDKESVKERSLTRLAEEAIAGGAGILQLRNKISASDEFYADALEIKEVTQHFNIPLIINDRLDIALAAKADGVHLGQDDLPFAEARKLLGKQMILGVSVHNFNEFEIALKGKPDYWGVGTIYPSLSKTELQSAGIKIIEQLRPKTTLPLIAIGGITVENLEPVIQAGADGVAVISDLFGRQNVCSRAQEFVKEVKQVKDSLVVA
ncbi:MAG: thiamine phosphate synthase [Caldithrix sp.]|nr:MAG: thiamine phosphate synthase [Caldithrix sp.]